MELFGLGEEKSPLQQLVEKELFQDRVIYLNEDISDMTNDHIVPLIKHINIQDSKNGILPEDRAPIEIHVTTPGGSCYDGWALVTAIESSKTPVHTYCPGYAMSMGLPVFLAGHKRFGGKYTTFLYHELRGQASGTREEVKRLDKEYDRLQKMYDEYIVERTKVTQETLNQHQEKISDWYISAQEAAEYEFFDEWI